MKKCDDLPDREQGLIFEAINKFLTAHNYSSLSTAVEMLNMPAQQLWNNILREADLPECEMPASIKFGETMEVEVGETMEAEVEISPHIKEIVRSCLEKRMEAPYTLVAVGANGTVSALKLYWNDTGDELRVKPLTEHIEGSGLQMPINAMIADSLGEAIQIVITHAGVKYMQ
jgi:hypothetical protein